MPNVWLDGSRVGEVGPERVDDLRDFVRDPGAFVRAPKPEPAREVPDFAPVLTEGFGPDETPA